MASRLIYRSRFTTVVLRCQAGGKTVITLSRSVQNSGISWQPSSMSRSAKGVALYDYVPPPPQLASSSMPTRLSGFALLLVTLGAFATSGPSAPPPVAPGLLAGLVWRNLGPFRGGRISAVSGAIGQPGGFYIGLPAGRGPENPHPPRDSAPPLSAPTPPPPRGGAPHAPP